MHVEYDEKLRKTSDNTSIRKHGFRSLSIDVDAFNVPCTGYGQHAEYISVR
ncbi:hypothetical protein GCM10025794_33090 [Massilia kyonggiensis]